MAETAAEKLLRLALEDARSKRPAAAPVQPAGPAPGDPGWALVPTAAPAAAAAPVASAPAGAPRPGEKGFSLLDLPHADDSSGVVGGTGTRHVETPAPKAPAKPQKPLSLAEQAALSNASINEANALAKGMPFLKDPEAVRQAHASSQSFDAVKQGASAAPVFLDSAGSQQAVQPQVVPAHEVALVSPERQKEKLAAIEGERDALAGENLAVEGEKSAERELANAKGGVGAARAEGWERVSRQAKKSGEDAEARAFEDKKVASEMRAKLDAFSTMVADDKIDPQGMWNNASTGRKITWTLAKAFGAIQQGLLRLPTNQIVDQLADMAKQDVESQKANHAIKRGRLEDMRNFYNMAQAEAKDAREADALAHGYALESVKAEAQALADAASTPVAKAEGEKIVAALGEKQAQTMGRSAALKEREVDAGIAMNKWVPAGVAGGGAGHKIESKNVFFDPVSGMHYAAKNEKSRDKLTQSGAAVTEFNAAAEQYTNALSKLTAWDKIQAKAGITTPNMAAAQTAYNHGLGIIRKDQHDGVWKKSETEMLAGTWTPPDHFSGDPKKQAQLLKDQVLTAHKSNMETEVPDPVVAVPQPVGSAPKNVPTGQNYDAPQAVAPGSVGFTPAGHRAKGGPTEEAKPYLVGEKGVELIAPDEDGFVMTALQTAKLLGAPPTEQQLASLTPAQRATLAKIREPVEHRATGGEVLASMPEPNMSVQPPPPPEGAPQMQFDPKAGWYDANRTLSPELDETLGAQAGKDKEDAAIDQKLRDQQLADDNADEARKIRNSFEAEQILQNTAEDNRNDLLDDGSEARTNSAIAAKKNPDMRSGLTAQQKRALWLQLLPQREDGGEINAAERAQDWIADQLGRLYPTPPSPDFSKVRAPDEPRKAQTAGAKMDANVRGKREDGGPVEADEAEKAKLYHQWLEAKRRAETTGAKLAPSPTRGKYVPEPVAAREDGGPIGAIKKLVDHGIDHITGALSAPKATPQPREAVVTEPHHATIYTAPDGPSSAPKGSGPVTVPYKRVGPEARACGGEIKGMWREVAKRGR